LLWAAPLLWRSGAKARVSNFILIYLKGSRAPCFSPKISKGGGRPKQGALD